MLPNEERFCEINLHRHGNCSRRGRRRLPHWCTWTRRARYQDSETHRCMKVSYFPILLYMQIPDEHFVCACEQMQIECTCFWFQVQVIIFFLKQRKKRVREQGSFSLKLCTNKTFPNSFFYRTVVRIHLSLIH